MLNLIDKTKPWLSIPCLFCFVYFLSAAPSPICGQPFSSGHAILLSRAENEFDNGNYAEAIELAGQAQTKARKAPAVVSQSLDIIACSQISLQKFAEAETVLDEALRLLPDTPSHSPQRAGLYLRFAWLYRAQRKFDKAMEFSNKAFSLAPANNRIRGEYYLNVGRIFFSKGLDISAIVWLEKAEEVFKNETNSAAKLDTLRFLALSWQAKLNYPVALNYAEKLVSSAEKTKFKFKYRQALLDLGNLLSATGQREKTFNVLKKGLDISVRHNNASHASLFLSQLLLNSLYNNDLRAALDYLNKLQTNERNKFYSFEIALGRAVIAAYQGEREISDKLFAKLEETYNGENKIFPILHWKITIAEKFNDWKQVVRLNQQLLEMTRKSNFLEDLPRIFLTFARAYFQQGEIKLSEEYLEKSLAYIENIRSSENAELSVNLFETYHNAYRLFSELKADTPEKALELSDFLKSRLLQDKINGSLEQKDRYLFIPSRVKQKIEELSLKLVYDHSIEAEIINSERDIINKPPELNVLRLNLEKLDATPDLNHTAIISYLFLGKGNLLALVWQKDKPVQTVQLTVSEEEIHKIAVETHKKLKQFIFFKHDGKAIYDKLLKPLAVEAKHLIIIPDKSLWKIPFQALSGDGKTYLIENQTISYAPSVSILLNQLNASKAKRQTFQAFSNSSYKNLYLKFADSEAAQLARLYNTLPHLDTTITTFKNLAGKSDILHFSMHAEINPNEPFNSFLAFKPGTSSDGRLTVGELLKMKLKNGSLVFLASCDTNNVFSGEGLVSLAWGMMGAGASTVISAQWEANDQSTGIFTKAFYKYYRQGFTSAESMQKASIEMIYDSSNTVNEPYFWAEFTLNGDYR